MMTMTAFSGRSFSVLLREHEVNADGELRPAARKLDGVLERGARCHDRRRRHDTAIEGLDDAAVHGLGDPEIVGVDDELRSPVHRCSANAQCFMPR
jgi:hypothetical protein